MRHNHGAPVRVSTALSLPLRLKTLEHRTSPFLLFLFSTPPCRHWACPTLVRSNSLLLFILFKRQIYHSRNLVFEGLRVKYGEKRRFARRHILFLVILSHFPILKKYMSYVLWGRFTESVVYIFVSSILPVGEKSVIIRELARLKTLTTPPFPFILSLPSLLFRRRLPHSRQKYFR